MLLFRWMGVLLSASSLRHRLQQAIEQAGQIALEAAHGFPLVFALTETAGDVSLGLRVDAAQREDDRVRRAIQASVAPRSSR